MSVNLAEPELQIYLLAHGVHTPEQSRALAKKNRIKIISRFQGHCILCGYHDLTYGELLVVHHIVPVEKKGHGGRSNLIPICRNCHAVVHALADPAFRLKGQWYQTLSVEAQVKAITRFGYTEEQAIGIAIVATQDAWFDGHALRLYHHDDEPVETTVETQEN